MDSIELAAIIGQDLLSGRALTIAPAAESRMIEKEVSVRLNVDSASPWWWQQARSRLVLISSDERDIRVSLSRIGAKRDGRIYLLACDDEPPPWPCATGSLDDIAELVGKARYFEFMLVDPAFQWIAFETHHNEFLLWHHGRT